MILLLCVDNQSMFQIRNRRFATAADRQRVEAVIRRGVRSGLCRSDILTAAELITV